MSRHDRRDGGGHGIDERRLAGLSLARAQPGWLGPAGFIVRRRCSRLFLDDCRRHARAGVPDASSRGLWLQRVARLASGDVTCHWRSWGRAGSVFRVRHRAASGISPLC